MSIRKFRNVLGAAILAAGMAVPGEGVAESCIESGSTERECADSAWQVVETFDSWFEEYVWEILDPFRFDGRCGLSILIH